MKLNEIMMIKKDDTGNRLKLFQVDDDTLAKLTKIRGNLYKDDPRLRIARDLPTPEPKISPEMQARAEAAYQICLAEKASKAWVMPVAQIVPMTFEEQLAHDWRHSPSLRKEFTSFGSYQAFMRAAKEGRTKVCGRG